MEYDILILASVFEGISLKYQLGLTKSTTIIVNRCPSLTGEASQLVFLKSNLKVLLDFF